MRLTALITVVVDLVALAYGQCGTYDTCNLNVRCSLNISQLSVGDAATCKLPTTNVPCRACAGPGQKCANAPECKDALFYCDSLTLAQALALPASHPCLNTACQLNKNSAACIASTYQYCCVPGTPNCDRSTADTGCTPSGCSTFLGQQALNPNYSAIPCPFQDAAATCASPQCNATSIYQQLVNTFSGNLGCSATYCISKMIPGVCAAGATLSSSTTANFTTCTNNIVAYCSANPTDPGCVQQCPYNCNRQDDCPCRSSACDAVRQAPMCVRTAGACAAFRQAFVGAMFAQRNFQPASDNRAYTKNNAGPPVTPFQWSADLTAARDGCNAVVAGLGDAIATCVQTSFRYCNANPWDSACKSELSVCGDGIVSWFETCDEGPNVTATGGCVACKTALNWECYQQGTPCKRCLHQTGYVLDAPNPGICPFCALLLPNIKWPCATTTPCANPVTLAEKTACDDYVQTYCNGIAANPSLRDPGCDSYVNLTKPLMVPSIPRACELTIKTVAINDPQLYALKFAVFNCPYRSARTSRAAPSTPLYAFKNPLEGLTDADRASLTPAALQALSLLYGNKTSRLYPLTDLALSDFSPYVNTSVVVNGMPLRITSIAQLTLFQSTPNLTSPQCSPLPFDTPLLVLPPSKHPLRWALKAHLTQLQYTAINGNDASLGDFAALALDELETDAIPAPATFQAAVLLSQSRLDASGIVVETPRQTCATVSGSVQCLDIEAAITSGRAQLHFGKLLFDASCTDTTCAYPVDQCRMVPLVPKPVNLEPAAVQATASAIVEHIGDLDTAVSRVDALGKFVQIAMTASAEGYSDTVALFNAITVFGTEPVTKTNVRNYCPKAHYTNATTRAVNPSWAADPCCNPAVAQFMCCAPATVPGGSIAVVKGYDPTLVNSYCPGTPALTMQSFLNAAYTTLQSTRTAVASLDRAMTTTSWTTLTSIVQTCKAAIDSAPLTPCFSDLDCGVCAASTCLLDPRTGQGACAVPYDALDECTAECFGATMDTDLLRFLKDQWGLAPQSSSAAFSAALKANVFVQQCVGPYATLPGIGSTQEVYACNATCQVATMCDDAEYAAYLSTNARTLLDLSVPATCTSQGGRVACAGYAANGTCNANYCTFDVVASACKDQNECRRQCSLPLTQGGCVRANGRWYTDQYNQPQCCPPEAYFNASNTAAPCSYALPTAPANAYTITDPMCCAAQNGTWYVAAGNGACCFGKVTSILNNGVPQLTCITKVTSWNVASCLASCNAMSPACAVCRQAQAAAGCCATTTVVANETACLAPTICTNQLVPAASCNDPTPFCAKCAGSVCTSVTKWPTCTLSAFSSAACTTAGGTWNATTKVCAALTGTSIAGPDCLRTDVCPSTTDVSRFYTTGAVPKYPRHAVTCQSGCFLPAVAQATCGATANYLWLADHAGGNGICVTRVSSAACADLGGTYVAAARTYSPGAFTTSDMCAEGNCVGSPFTDGWGADQCKSQATWAACSVNCPKCTVPASSPFAAQGSGACFSSSVADCAALGYSAAPCINAGVTSAAACALLSNTAWKACDDYGSASACTNAADVYATTLGCAWTTPRCATAAACAAQGSCNDGDDSRRSVCLDAGWAYGDTCSASVASATSTVVYTCTKCAVTNGVCVAPAIPSAGCATAEQWHPLGCRVYGVATATACATSGGTWVTRATTQAACLAPQGCLEPGASKLSSKSASECTKCGGSLHPWYTWTPGVWAPAFVERYTWQAQGTTLVPANAYKPTLSLQQLGKALAVPVARRVAMLQKTKALLLYNGMTDVLRRLACACGRSANASCWTAAADATLVSQTRVFCGQDTAAIPTGAGTAVLKMPCPSGRRLSTVGSSAELSFSTYSLAAYAEAYAPFCASQAINPLAVTAPGGLVYGQLLGAGTGVTASEPFESVSLCLPIDANVRQWPAFDTLDVAELRDGVFVPLNLTAFGVISSDQVCVSITENGVYFPIRRAAAAYAAPSCPLQCGSAGGRCVFNATTNAAECVCKCGFSGTLCTSGCPNACSGNGDCYQNTCYCRSGYTGVDCSQVRCPTDAAGQPCSNNGLCQAGACVCNLNYQGVVCDTPLFALLNGSAPADFVSTYVASTDTGP
ncbi:hypothetical protein ACHHYP_03513, partial [Achlya hypogyna]